MPNAAALLTFLVALLVLEITPGPDMMLVMARGVGQGRRVALWTVFGMIFVAGFVQVALLVFGIASLLRTLPAALVLLQWVGAAYLVCLGVKMLRSSRGLQQSASARRPTSARNAVREGTINSLTNPKSLLFMFAFLPQFVDSTAGPVWLQLLVLGSIQKLVGVLSLGGVALASGSVGQWLVRWPRLQAWQERFTGVVMIALGIRLLAASDATAFRK